MALRNVPKSYTFEQQRQEINSLATDVGDISQLASGLPNLVAAINQISIAGDDGGSLLSGTLPPTSADGANGDFYLDTVTKELYGPKTSGSWPSTTISISEQILSGVVAPLSNQGKLNDYYFNSTTKELYGPKTAQGWGLPTSLGDADYVNVLYVKPDGSDTKSGASPSKAFKTIKAAAVAAASLDGNTTIRVSTGTYYEDNPIYLPKGTSIVGDNLRETIVIPKNEGRDIFWVTSGCYINYMVFEDNFLGGKGFLETEISDNRTLSAVDTSFRVLPGHTLSRVDDIYLDGANLIEYQKDDIIDLSIDDLVAEFPDLLTNPDYDEVTCRRDIGFIVDGIVADLRSGGNVKSIKNGLAYKDGNGDLIAAVVGEEVELIYSFERAAYHAKQKILTVPAGFTEAGYDDVTLDVSGYPECSKVQDSIDSLVAIVIDIIQGEDVPQYAAGPGYILVDQEWMKIVSFNESTGQFLVARGQSDPITDEPTTASKHITGAVVSQSAFTWRYAVAYPEQSGIVGKGRVNLLQNSPVVNGNISTRFTLEIQPGWRINISGNEYTVLSVDSDDQLTLSEAVPTGQGKLSALYKIIPPKERIFLSPYTQNCSCISKLGRAVFNPLTLQYDADKTRAGGLLADGNQLEGNSPLESMVVDAFTQVVFGSIGFHMKNDAYTQLVSVFQVFELVGVLCESGGYASITNSATNFGNEGLKAVGYSNKVLPIFSGGQVSSVTNVTKTDINQLPSDIIGTVFSSAAGGTKVRATIEVSIVDISKFERGQAVTIIDHISTPTINGSGIVVDTVDFQNNKISVLLDIPWDSDYVNSPGSSTGSITIATGSVFTQFVVSGFQAPPISNFIIKVPGLGLDLNGNEHVVGEVIDYNSNNAIFTTNFPLTNQQVAAIANNAAIRLYSPSTVNSSGHTFEYVGSGINYTAFPQNGGVTVSAAQSVEVNSGKCYVSATDQSGNFSVGPFFNVNLRSGKVTFNGSVALGILDSLQLKGSPGVPIFKFSPDDTLGGSVGAEHTVLPTQKAVREYINKSSVLGNFVGLNKGTASIPGLIVQLDATGKINVSQLPQSQQFVVYTVEDELDRLQEYIPVSNKSIISNTTSTITLNNVSGLFDGLLVTGQDIPANTRITIGGIDISTNTITVDQSLPALTSGALLSFIGNPVKPGDIVIQKNEEDGDSNTVLQTWILSQLPATDTDNWELLSLNQIDAAAIVSGIVSPNRLGTGIPNDDTYLNGISKYTPVVKGILPPVNSAITVGGTREILKKISNPVNIASASWSASTNKITFNTTTPHLFNNDNYVEIESVNPDTYNGTYQVTVVDTDTFTVDKTTNPGSFLSTGTATLGEIYDSGYLELDVSAAAYSSGQNSGSSSLGVSRFRYDTFDINTQSVVSIRDKGITLGKIQNIRPKTLLGNNGALAANPEEIEIGIGVAGVPTFQVSVVNNKYSFVDENISQDLGVLPDLQLVPGKEYVFKLGTVTGHPFNIVTSPGAIGANLYTTGVLGNGNVSNTIVRFTVPQNAPSFLYYQSGIDSTNFGVIKIVKIPDNLEVIDSTSSATITIDQFGASAVNTVKYVIQMKNTVNNYIHSTEILLLQDGTDVYLSEYSTLYNNRLLGSFSADIQSGQVRLRYTPAFDGDDYLNRLIIQKNYVTS